MKWVITTGIIGLIGLVAIAYGAWHWWHTGSIDTAMPGFVDGYKSSFITSCAKGAELSAANAGRSVDEAMKSTIQKICICGADESVEVLRTREHMTMSDMMDDPVLKQKLPDIMHACTRKFIAQ